MQSACIQRLTFHRMNIPSSSHAHTHGHGHDHSHHHPEPVSARSHGQVHSVSVAWEQRSWLLRSSLWRLMWGAGIMVGVLAVLAWALSLEG